MTPKKIKTALKLHRKWLDDEEGGVRADFSNKDLRGANFRGANLRGADLSDADLSVADLRGVDLSGANLSGADLSRANLSGADLSRADLRGVDLPGADLTDAKLPDFQLPTGELLGYKKVRDGVVLTLEISEERTASLVSNKCRCRSAKVLSASVEGTEFKSIYDPNFIYRVGETVVVEKWSDDIRVECAPGIHFFKTYEEALDYRF